MALDPAAQGLLDQLDELGVPPIESMTPVECRQTFAALKDPDAPLAEVKSVVDREISGVPTRIYTPEGVAPFPVLVWLHGGGWVVGSMEEDDPVSRELCSRSGCIVVNVEYRLAPEHPFPAPVEDTLSVSQWVAENAAAIGGDPSKLVVGGHSAGGNLAAIACQQLPGVFAFQVLVYPVTDMTFSFPSIEENAEGYLLTKASMEWFRRYYLEDAEPVELTDPLLSPLFADDKVFSNMPPAFVVTAGFDPLRDEGQAYAHKLQDGGVDVELRHYPDQIHSFYTNYLAIPTGYDAIDATAAALHRAFS